MHKGSEEQTRYEEILDSEIMFIRYAGDVVLLQQYVLIMNGCLNHAMMVVEPMLGMRHVVVTVIETVLGCRPLPLRTTPVSDW